MELTNALYKYRDTTAGAPAWQEAVDHVLLLSAPVVPHIAEELWARRGRPYSIHQQAWPAYDAAAAAEDVITLVVQVNGKVRDWQAENGEYRRVVECRFENEVPCSLCYDAGDFCIPGVS